MFTRAGALGAAMSCALLLGACSGGGGGAAAAVTQPDNALPPTPAHNAVLHVSPGLLEVQAGAGDAAPSARFDIVIDNPPESIHVFIAYDDDGVRSVDAHATSETRGVMNVQFRDPGTLAPGTYADTITLYMCYDVYCKEPLAGSPALVRTTYTVTASQPAPPPGPQPEPGIDPLPLTSTQALSHDVLDAEYSAALDAVIMVSSYPDNALYAHDTATGTERKFALDKPPMSVSVAPDGLSAAVGHDALISLVDLRPDIALPKRRFEVSTAAWDIVLAGNGYVHAFPERDQWVAIHSVEIATGIETLGGSSIYAHTRAKLHPGGTAMYGADNGLSPSDIEHYDIASGPVGASYDSPYHGDHAMCGNLWIAESGLHIYTACGNVFRASMVQTQDMLYSGQLALSHSDYYGYQIVSLSQSAERKDIALIEQDAYECSPYIDGTGCYSHVGFYESDFLNNYARYSLPPMEVAGQKYAQRGLFVFHSSGGQSRFLLSRLHGMPNPDAEYYFSVLQ